MHANVIEIIQYPYFFIFSDAVKKQVKFKSTPLNEIEDVIKYILAQSPFSMKRQLEKNVLSNSI